MLSATMINFNMANQKNNSIEFAEVADHILMYLLQKIASLELHQILTHDAKILPQKLPIKANACQEDCKSPFTSC